MGIVVRLNTTLQFSRLDNSLAEHFLLEKNWTFFRRGLFGVEKFYQELAPAWRIVIIPALGPFLRYLDSVASSSRLTEAVEECMYVPAG